MIGTQAVESPTSFPPSSHICWFYETEEEHRALVTSFLLQSLERGERVVYVTDARSAGTILGYLQDAGVDVGTVTERGQLVFRTAQETYLQDDRFNPDWMLALLRAETEGALTDGFTGLYITPARCRGLCAECPAPNKSCSTKRRSTPFSPTSPLPASAV